MNRSLPLLVLGGFFLVMGIVFFFPTLRAPQQKLSSPPKKAELRAQNEKRVETVKYRIASAAFAVVGAVLVLIS